MPEYKIAFSTMALDGKLVAGDPRWKEFNSSFENLELSPSAISWLIDEGHAFTTWHANNWRHSDNYILGQHIGVDFDTRSVAETLLDPFVQEYGALVYATPSSTPDNPRCRALFLLDTPIVQKGNYVKATSALLWMFGGVADKQCKDAVRFFYGCLGSMPTKVGKILPLAKVREVIAAHEALQRPAPKREYVPAGDDGASIAGTLDFAAHAKKGERNASLFWAACRWRERGVARSDAETMGMAVGHASGLGEAEVLATVRSAFRG